MGTFCLRSEQKNLTRRYHESSQYQCYCLLSVTFIPIFIIYGLAMISKGGTHSGDFSMISFVEVFTLIEILAVGILPAYGFIQGYIYHYQWLITEGKKTTSLPRRNLFIRLGVISPIAIVVFMEFLKRMFAY